MRTCAHQFWECRYGRTSPKEQLQLPQQWCVWHVSNLSTNGDGNSLLPCRGNKIDFGSQNNNHHFQSALVEETFIAAFTDNDQYFPQCWRFAVQLHHRTGWNRRAALAGGHINTTLALGRVASLYLRACLKRPSLNRIQRTVFVFSAWQQQKRLFWGKTGGKHNFFTKNKNNFYFAPAEHCRGANCWLLSPGNNETNPLQIIIFFLLLFCEFYLHRDTFISVRYHKDSRKPILLLCLPSWCLLATHQSFYDQTTAVVAWMATEFITLILLIPTLLESLLKTWLFLFRRSTTPLCYLFNSLMCT